MATLYTGLCLAVSTGLDFDGRGREGPVLQARRPVFAVSVTVNLITRSERLRRRAAVERERELQRERIELSKSIHDTVAQSAYLIGLGIETAIELTDRSNRELVEKLEATHDLSKSAVWELRHPIDGGLIFEGRDLAGALRSHAATFTAITSIPAELVQLGSEPPLSRVTRGLLFSIAHNAMTNAVPALPRQSGYHHAGLPAGPPANVRCGRRRGLARRLRRAGPRLPQHEGGRPANRRRA